MKIQTVFVTGLHTSTPPVPPGLPTRESRASKAGSRDPLKRSTALHITTEKYFLKSIAVLENKSQSLEPSQTFTGLLGDNQQTHL